MVEENSPKFKFHTDDQDPETFYREEIKDLRVEKLSQRVTLISILLPCLIAVAIYFGYRDLTGRMTTGQDTGSLEAQRLSKEIEDLSRKFNEKLIAFSTTLSTQDKDFDSTISGKLTTINKNFDVLYKNLKSLNKDFKQMKSDIKGLGASKADKKRQQVAIAKINTALGTLKKELPTLSDIRTELKSVSTEITNLENKLTKKISEIAANAEQSEKNYDQLQVSLTKLSNDKTDKATLNLEVFKLKKNFQLHISEAINGLNHRLDSLQKKIDDLQTISKSSKKSMKTATKKISPTSGTINEQDIPE